MIQAAVARIFRRRIQLVGVESLLTLRLSEWQRLKSAAAAPLAPVVAQRVALQGCSACNSCGTQRGVVGSAGVFQHCV